MQNPTLSDVARAAGVSYATADRVINARGNVAQKSILKVREAMASLGYVRNIAAANLSRSRVYRLAFLLPQGPNAFFARMRAYLDRLSDHLLTDRVSIEVIDVSAFEVESLKETLNAVAARDFDGVAVVGLQSAILDQPLHELRDKGVPVVGLVSDLPAHARSAYIGIDNIAAGRTAGRLVGMSHGGRRGVVQPIGGSIDARDHHDRLTGFCDVLRKDFPHVEVLEPRMTLDQAEVLGRVVREALSSDQEVTALYNAGAGNRGLIDAMRGVHDDQRVFCVAHELGPRSRQALLDGQIDLIIDQQPDIEIERACTVLRALIDARTPPPMPDLVPMIYVRDNLPAKIEIELGKDAAQ